MIRHAAFPVTLVFPPQGHFTQPYLALPCLKAWLEAHGFDDVELVDASVESYDWLLSPDVLARAAERVRATLPLERFADADRLDFRALEAYRAAAESAASADALVARIEDAKRTVRGAGFWERDAYPRAMRTLYHGLRLVSAAHFPTQVTPHNFTMGYANDRSRDVLAATLDDEQNPYRAFFRERLLPRLVARRPRVVGLSVIYGSQLVPALTLGRMIREALPGCHVTAGGGFLAYVGKKLLGAPGIDACLDSLVFHEGEAPLLGLCEALREGGELGGIGSLSWYDRSGAAARAVHNAPGHPIRLDDAPPPRFDGLPFALYFSPELVLPYDINRGCYYGECTFCTLPTVIGPGYRTRRAATIADHVLALRDEHGARSFNFITDCMPPGMIRDLPDELLARDAGVTWWSDARVEPKAYTPEGARKLYASGCRKLLFGFETATPRLLKMMQKGQSLRSTIDVARNCSEAGISVTFYAMVGFPSETREEARATLDFLIEHKDVVREVSLQTFHVDEVAQTYREPERFGIEILDDADADLQLYHEYRASQGMTSLEAAEMFDEMMAAFREHLPMFAGDNVLYFMQKSHYFLHLARGTTPAEFAAVSSRRADGRASARPESLAARSDVVWVDLPFSYTAAVERLAHPLARAVRPDFLTGRYVENAVAVAESAIGALGRAPRVLAYAADEAEFVELRPDGKRAFDAIRCAGTVGALCDELAPTPAARTRLLEFAGRLERLGLFSPAPRELTTR